MTTKQVKTYKMAPGTYAGDMAGEESTFTIEGEIAKSEKDFVEFETDDPAIQDYIETVVGRAPTDTQVEEIPASEDPRTVKDLRVELEQRGLETHGTKQDLIDRLEQADNPTTEE